MSYLLVLAQKLPASRFKLAEILKDNSLLSSLLKPQVFFFLVGSTSEDGIFYFIPYSLSIFM